jgi:DNA-binding MarR family transcriptional regulator
VSSPENDSADAPAAILRAATEMSARRAAFTQVVAERFGLAATDVECLGLLSSEGPMTVGRLGELTALTTGATTRMVDRLEQAGYVRRVADPADRRRVIVEPVPARTHAVARAYDPLDAAVIAALSDVPGEVRMIRTFLEAVVDGSRAALATARDSGAAGAGQTGVGGASESTAPVAAATHGRLVFVTAVPSVALTTDPALGGDLYRARFDGAVPSARVRDGAITIRYPRFAWFDFRTRIADQWVDASAHWRRDRTELVLNDRLPWTIEFRGGATAIDADLRSLRLGELGIAGGAGVVSLRLGVPAGVVPIRLKGGAKDLTVTRPLGVAATLSVTGGYRKATLDGVAAWSGGRIETQGAQAVPDRYEIEVTGGADRVAVLAVQPEG